jgi:SAM-dependent methyltransferase
MTWEETILYIRNKSEYHELVWKSYLSSNLEANVENYRNSQEFKLILDLLEANKGIGKRLLDVGSGNGITAISFALEGFTVIAVEPDPSETVGCGAIRILKEKYQLENLEIHQGFCEDIDFESDTFDITFARQCMHHAKDLNQFVSEMSRVLKNGGIFLTVRDHVVFDDKDKTLFLTSHALQKFYHGENAFSPDEYKNAIKQSRLKLINEFKYFDSAINYFPKSDDEIQNKHSRRIDGIRTQIKHRLGLFAFLNEIVLKLYLLKNKVSVDTTYDERKITGRMYSYLAKK